MPREAHEADENRWQNEQAENEARSNRIWDEILVWMKHEMTAQEFAEWIEVAETDRMNQGFKTELAGLSNILEAVRKTIHGHRFQNDD